MNKKMKRFIIIALLSIFAVNIILVAVYLASVKSFFHTDNKTETLLMSSQSPYGAYTVEIREIGEPWLIGDSTVAIWIRNADGEEKKFLQTMIANGGVTLCEEENYRVIWVEDGAVIKLDGFEQTEKTIRIKNEEFDF